MDRSGTRPGDEGNRSAAQRGWGHPLCGTNVGFYKIHFLRYWTGVRFRLGRSLYPKGRRTQTMASPQAVAAFRVQALERSRGAAHGLL